MCAEYDRLLSFLYKKAIKETGTINEEKRPHAFDSFFRKDILTLYINTLKDITMIFL